MNWISIMGLCLIVLGTVFSFFGTYYNDKQGKDELSIKIQEKNKTIDSINESNAKLVSLNASLLGSNGEVFSTNSNLIVQNSNMLDKISKYQTDLEIRNKKIESLQNEVGNIKAYSYYATLDVMGQDKEYVGMSFHSDLSNRMRRIVTSENGQETIKTDSATQVEINEVINKFPNFPFGYYVKYKFEKLMNVGNWKVTAKKALEIFEVTTSIEGHSPSHDNALKELQKDLSTN